MGWIDETNALRWTYVVRREEREKEVLRRIFFSHSVESIREAYHPDLNSNTATCPR